MTQKPDQDNEVTQLKRALVALKEMRAKVEALEGARTEPVAVIGMGCRFPGGADTPAAFWKLLVDGVDAITEVPADRWPADEVYASDFMQPGKANTRWGGFIDHIDQFDPAFFGISPREAIHMDPQQRILLQVAFEALEDAGLSLDALEGSLTGVFTGIHSHSSDYAWMQMRDLNDIDTHTGAGTAHSIVANRLSYLFNWQGPSIALDTACSSSLVAAHLACQSLRNRECNLALVAGVNLLLTPESTIAFSKLQMMASDGRCKTFDSRADGFVRSEGCGVLVLKRMSDAIADGDRILALIQGSAVNQDGRTNGLTAPNGLSQQNVIRQALANGRVSAEQIGYVEMHGTGTKLGDPIEVEALAEVIGKRATIDQPCVLGAVKANIGHLEAAAGIAGLIKSILVLQHGLIPPQLHIQQVNPLIQLAGTRLEIATAPREFKRTDNSARFTSVSSFGFGGTNAHVILRDAPLVQESARDSVPAPYILSLSARSHESLNALATRYRDFLSDTTSTLTDILYTANLRRTHHEKRMTVVGASTQDLIEKLNAFLKNDPHPDTAHGQVVSSGERGLVFVFSGQGPQWAGMGCELMQSEPAFRNKLNEIDALLKQYVDWSLIDELNKPEASSRLSETEIAQPAIFAMQVALTALWRSWGIEPEAVVGHSVGEIAAAHVAGVLSLEDAVRVVYHRSRLMQRVTGQGRMAALGISRQQVETLASNHSGLSLAAVNSPVSTVLSGDAEALEEIVASLTAAKTFARMLPVNYAFHSPVMDGLMEELTESLKGIAPRAAGLVLYSTVSGGRARTGDYEAAYWATNIRQPVLFGPVIAALTAGGFNTFVEVSPHPVLSESIAQCLDPKESTLIVSSLRRMQPERGVMLRGLGALFTRGYPVNWEAVTPKGQIVDLPHYCWQNARYWLPNSQFTRYSRTESAAPQNNADWFYDLTWQELSETTDAVSSPGDWLILGDRNGIGTAITEQLVKYGQGALVITDEVMDLGAWLRSVPNPLGIIDLRAMTITAPLDDSVSVSVLSSIKALANYTGTASPRLWLVTQGVYALNGESVTPNATSQSLLWGLGRTLSLEHPDAWGGLIDVEMIGNADAAGLIAQEINGPRDEDQIAIRAGRRYGLRLQHAEKPASNGVTISNEGTYLITGGLGGLGQQVARWLGRHGAAHIVATSRTGISTRSAAFVSEMADMGVTLSVMKVDVADEAQMTALFQSFGATLPALRGVIHAAGLVSTQTLSAMDETSFREVLRPKVAGAWLLHHLTQNLTLDFFILFSSNSALLGAAELGHYAAANSYLDTLAHMRHGMGLPALSVNWGWWSGPGMATAELGQKFRQIGQNAMSVDLALDAMNILAGSGIVQAMVADIDWDIFKPIYESRRQRPLLERINVHAEGRQQTTEPLLAQQLLTFPVSQRSEALQLHVRDQVAHVLGFSASEKIDPQQGFFSIGMDSVMAVQLRTRLEANLGHTLPATLAFEYPTIESLSRYLFTEVLKLDEITTGSRLEVAALPNTTTDPKPLSEDELLTQLDDELAAFNKLTDGN